MLKADKKFFSVEARRFGNVQFLIVSWELTGAQNFTACTAFIKRAYGKPSGPYFLLLAIQRVENLD